MGKRSDNVIPIDSCAMWLIAGIITTAGVLSGLGWAVHGLVA